MVVFRFDIKYDHSVLEKLTSHDSQSVGVGNFTHNVKKLSQARYNVQLKFDGSIPNYFQFSACDMILSNYWAPTPTVCINIFSQKSFIFR